MAKRNRPPVEKYHDRVAGIYDTIYEGKPYWELVSDITWRHMRRFLPQNLATRSLDLGCGTGRWGLKLLKTGFPTDFLDISVKMLDQVALKLAKLGKPFERVECIADRPRSAPTDLTGAPPIQLYHATVDDLSGLPAEHYGLIVGQGDPLNCAERPERALKQLARALSPGGIMVMSVDNRLAGIYHYFKGNDIAGLANFVRNGKTTWVTDDPAEQYPVTMFTPEEIRRMCAARDLELLSLIGKTVLPLRRFRDLLQEASTRKELLRIEESLHATEAMLANAAHLEFIARKAK